MYKYTSLRNNEKNQTSNLTASPKKSIGRDIESDWVGANFEREMIRSIPNSFNLDSSMLETPQMTLFFYHAFLQGWQYALLPCLVRIAHQIHLHLL